MEYKAALRGLKISTMLKEVSRAEGESSRDWKRRALGGAIALVGRFVMSFGRMDSATADKVLDAFARWTTAY